MASNLVKFHTQSFQISHKFFHLNLTKLPSSTSLGAKQLGNVNHSVSFTRPLHLSKFHVFPLQCSISSPPTPPPTTKEDAISQAKLSLLTTLEKPLNNPKLVSRLKKPKQPRFRVEIPVVDDSPSSLSLLAVDIFADIPIKRKGPSKIKILLLWPNQTLTQAAQQAFESTNSSNPIIENIDISSVITSEGETRMVSSADVVVFMAPEASRLTVMNAIVDTLYPKPILMFNPKWGFEEESSFGDQLTKFVGSFEVVYSFMGLEVRGILSQRKGVIFRCIKDGVMSGDKWYIFVEEEDGELKVISRFKTRPSIEEVENVLYNLMAMNSPITKSAKFLKDLVSNVRGQK